MDDHRLLEVLAGVLDETDPVPADALDAARAVDLAGLDEQLAELVFDSLLDDLALTRATPGHDDEVRTLAFTAGGLRIDVDLADADLVGRVTPPPGAAGEPVQVLQTAGRRSIDCDERGFFRSPVEPGPLRLRFSHAATVTTTPWISR